MKKLIFLILISFTLHHAISAQIGVLTSGGNQDETVEIKFSYSVGQVLFTGSQNPKGSIQPGFQQTYEVTTISSSSENMIKIVVHAFPNPTSDFLNISIDENITDEFEYQLITTKGSLISANKVYHNHKSLNLKSIPSGIYYLTVVANDQNSTFRIIKN